MRENEFDTNQLMYLGERDDSHWYLIAGKHEVPVEDIDGFDKTEVDE